MSETIKSTEQTRTEQARKVQDTVSRPSQATIDATTSVLKETIGQTAQASQRSAEKGRQASHAAVEATAHAAGVATDLSGKVAEQSREVVMLGVRTADGVRERVADIADQNFGRGQHMLTSAAQAMDVYRDAAERSSSRLQALFTSCLTLTRGMQQMQQAWLEMVDQSLEAATHKPQDLLRCKNIVELAEVQRDLYLDAVHHTLHTSGRLLDMAGRTAQEAVRPLQTIHN